LNRRRGNGIRHINEVKLRRARLVLGLVTDLWRVYHPDIYPGPLSLAIPLWVGALSTGDGFGRLWEETAPLKLRPYPNPEIQNSLMKYATNAHMNKLHKSLRKRDNE